MYGLHSYKLSEYALIREKCSRPDFTWKIEGINEIMDCVNFPMKNKKTVSVESEKTFAWKACPHVEARAKLTFNRFKGSSTESVMEVGLSLKRRPDHEGPEQPQIRPLPTVHYVLIDRSENGAKHKVRSSLPDPLGQPFDHAMTFERSVDFREQLLVPPFNVDDSVLMEIYVQSPVTPVHSFNGILNWTIEDFQKVKAEMKECPSRELDSPYFYTGVKGYRARATFKESEDPVDTWLAWSSVVEISFLSGAEDARISPSFPHLITVELINPDYPTNGVRKTVCASGEEDPRYSYELTMETDNRFIIHAERLLIQVAVQPSVPMSEIM